MWAARIRKVVRGVSPRYQKGEAGDPDPEQHPDNRFAHNDRPARQAFGDQVNECALLNLLTHTTAKHEGEHVYAHLGDVLVILGPCIQRSRFRDRHLNAAKTAF